MHEDRSECVALHKPSHVLNEDLVVSNRSLAADGEYGPGQAPAYAHEDGGAPPFVLNVVLEGTVSVGP